MTATATPHPASRRGRDDRGAILMIVAIGLPVLLLMTAFAVDLGRQRAARRDMQAKADVIALDLARLITSGTPADQINYSTALNASASRNNVAVAKITGVQWGTLDSATKKFIACASCIPTAVKVTTHDTISYFFQRGTGDVTRSAVAGGGSPEAGLLLGSFAAQAPTAGNSILRLAQTLFPGLNAQLVGFNGLASSNVNLLDVLAANPINIGSPSQVANSTVTLGQLTAATATVLQNHGGGPGDAANAALLNGLINAGIPSTQPIHLGDLINVAPNTDGAALDGDVNVLDLILAGAQLANGKSGAEITGLGLNLNNLGGTGISLASATADVNIIQPPQYVFGPPGKSGRTDQITTTIHATLLGGLLGALANSDITIQLSTASATATIGNIRCTNPQAFDFSSGSGLAAVTITVKVSVLGLGLINLVATKPAGTDTVFGTFTRTDDGSDPDHQTFTPDTFEVNNGKLGLSGLTVSPNPLGLGSLITNTLLPVLDTYLLAPLVSQIGINVGGAELHGVRTACLSGVRLVG